MKVFKTILRTSLFWFLALVGLRIYTNYESQNSNLVSYRANALPESVKQHLYDQSSCSCPDCDATTEDKQTPDLDEILSKIPATCKTFHDGCNTCNRLANGEIACTLMQCENYEEPKCLDEENTTWAVETQLLPAKTTQIQSISNDELATLKNKVAELEKEHWALVQELQAIFSTPEAQKLLPTAPSTTR